MTTEDDFQAALDADPADWQTRLPLLRDGAERDVVLEPFTASPDDEFGGGWRPTPWGAALVRRAG